MKRVKVLALLIAICLVWPVATQQTWMKDRDRLAVSAYAEEEDISDFQFGNDDTSSNKPTKSPSGNKDKNKGNSGKKTNTNKAADPTPVPQPKLYKRVDKTQEELTTHTLSFAASEVQPSVDYLSLEQDALDNYFGTEVKVIKGAGDGNYIRPDENGKVGLLVDGILSYIRIEDNDMHILWAGVLEGNSYRAPEGKKRTVISRDVPRELVYWTDAEPVEGDAEGSLILDLSEIMSVYGDKVQIQKGVEGSAIHSVVDPDENGICVIEKFDKDYFIYIEDKSDKLAAVLWAGKFAKPADGKARRISFHMYPDWKLGVSGLDSTGSLNWSIGLEFGGEADYEAIAADLSIVNTLLTEKNQFEDKEWTIKANEFSDGCSAKVKLKSNFKVATFISKLLYKDEEVYAQVSAVTPYSAPVDEQNLEHPEIKLNDTAVLRVDGGVTFSGSVITSNGGNAMEDWTFYIGRKACDQVKFLKAQDGEYSFVVSGYPVDVDTAALEIFVQNNKNEELKSNIITLNVNLPVATVLVEGYAGYYDGNTHTISASVTGNETDVIFMYADATAEVPEWSEAVPVHTDAGAYEWYVKAEKEGYDIAYVDSEGNPLEETGGYVTESIVIDPVPVSVNVFAEQNEEAVYDGTVQNIDITYKAEIEQDESGLFDISLITENDAWTGEEVWTMPSVDAGEYPIEPEDGRFGFIEELDPNFTITATWDESSAIVVQKAKVTLTSGSQMNVYGNFEGELTCDEPVVKSGPFADGDYFSGDATTNASRSDAGVEGNEIVINEAGEFKNHENNYELTRNEGVLIVFPQSISESDPTWESAAATIKAEDFAKTIPAELPGFYCGMRAELVNELGEYDGEAHDVQIRFRNANGTPVNMQKGVDYDLVYYRSGEETEDVTSAGSITVSIVGKGNYRGAVDLVYEIERQSVKNAEITLEGWTYDGEAAGSEAHPIIAAGVPEKYIYRNGDGDEIDPPSDAGFYSVQAVWSETDNYEGMESNLCQFRIAPAEVTVKIDEEGNVEVSDESGLFDADTMIIASGLDYECVSDNFNVKFKIDDAARVRNAQEQAALRLEDWTYDGQAAGSEAHPIESEGIEANAVYRYYDSEGNEIEAPVNAGSYVIEAVWGSPEVKIEHEFVIMHMPVTVSVEDVSKNYGEADPEFETVVDGVMEGDTISRKIEREPGEDAGTYAISLTGETIQGNYEVLFENAQLEIRPLDVSGYTVELLDGEVVVTDDSGKILSGETDFDAQVEDIADKSEEKRVTVTGKGNYTGENSSSCKVVAMELELTLTDAAGNAIENGKIESDKEDKVTIGGVIRSNIRLDAENVSISFNQLPVDAEIENEDENTCRFKVENVDLAASKPENIDVSVLVKGEERASESLAVKYMSGMLLWLVLAIAMSVGAVISFIICIRLGKQIKKERFKLLDAVSRQSNRTIRENQD